MHKIMSLARIFAVIGSSIAIIWLVALGGQQTEQLAKNVFDLEPTSRLQQRSRTESRTDLKCPYPDGIRYHEQDTHIPFKILCNTNIQGRVLEGDDDDPGAFHADTIDICINTCANHIEPQCQSVVWNPSKSRDEANCFLKSAIMEDIDHIAVPQTTPPFHSAVLWVSPMSYNCTTDTVVGASNGQHFKVGCGTAFDTDNLSVSHTPTFKACLSTCMDYVDSQAVRKCSAVAWDLEMYYGYANCHLKSSDSNQIDVSHHFVSAFATSEPLSKHQNHSHGGDGNEDHSSNDGNDDNSTSGINTTLITGLVVGAVALIVILVGLFWLYRRRQKSHELALLGTPLEYYNHGPELNINGSFETHGPESFRHDTNLRFPVESDNTMYADVRKYAVHMGDDPSMSPVELDSSRGNQIELPIWTDTNDKQARLDRTDAT